MQTVYRILILGHCCSRTARPHFFAFATTFSDATTKYYQASATVSFWQKRLILLGAFRADQVDRSQRLFLRPLDHPSGYGALTRDHFIYRPNAPADYFKLTYVPKNAAGVATGPSQLAPATRPRRRQ